MDWDDLDEFHGYDKGGWLQPGVTRVLYGDEPVYDPAAHIESGRRYINERYGIEEQS